MAASLAAEIRLSSSDQWDLKGYSESQAEELVQAAFSTPLPLSEMVRFSFIIGAGKLGRAKYNDSLLQWLTAALKQEGFNDDRGACCEMQCAGSFKFQHDTGKNLKFLHVFPKASAPAESSSGGDGESRANMDPAFLALTSSEDTFRKMVQKKMPAWVQKRRCNQHFKTSLKLLQTIEQKLFRGDILTNEEQELYQETNIGDIENKQKYLAEAMKKMVDNGHLTVNEKEILLAQLEQTQSKLKEEIATFAKEGKAKRVAKMEIIGEGLEARKMKITDIKPVNWPLANMNVLAKAWAVQIPLERHCPQHMLGEKEEISAKVEELLSQSRCWFEEEDEHALRVATARQATEKRLSKPKAQVKSSGSGRGGRGKPPKVSSSSQKKINPTNNIFAALCDSDSD